MSIEIKQAVAADAEIVAPLFDAYRIFYHQSTDLKAAAAFLKERMLQNESVIFIAYEKGVATGFCQMYPIFSSVSMRRTWLLNDLFVAAAYRGRGIAAALLEAGKQWGISTQSKWLLLQTGKDNRTAKSVYENNGWQKVDDLFYELPLG